MSGILFQTLYSMFNRQSAVTDKFKSIHHSDRGVKKLIWDCKFNWNDIIFHFAWGNFNLTKMCDTQNQHTRKEKPNSAVKTMKFHISFSVATFSLFLKRYASEKGALCVNKLMWDHWFHWRDSLVFAFSWESSQDSIGMWHIKSMCQKERNPMVLSKDTKWFMKQKVTSYVMPALILCHVVKCTLTLSVFLLIV